jgi:hypothetical protein
MADPKKQDMKEQLVFWLQVLGGIGPILVMSALYWLSINFVPRSEFTDIRPRLDAIQQTLIRMETQQRQLDDHESRIRRLEARQ